MKNKWYYESWAPAVIIPGIVFTTLIIIFGIGPWAYQFIRINARLADNWAEKVIECPVNNECKK